MVTRETLMAYADGQASAEESAAVERALEADPALVDQLERMLETNRRIADAWPEPAPSAADDALAALVRRRLSGEPEPQRGVASLAEHREKRRRTFDRFGWPSAIAASLLIGVGVGSVLDIGGSRLIVQSGSASPTAGRDLAAALSTAPSGAVVRIGADASVRPVLSFAASDGANCRQFRIDGRQPLDGVACREGERWRLRALASAAAAPQGGEFQTATGAGQDAVSTLVDGIIAGEPFDRAQEAARIRDGW